MKDMKDKFNNFLFCNSECKGNVTVKGRLKQHIEFWKSIGTNKKILNIIENGYKIPFIKIPPSAKFKNNNSAHENSDFVTKSLKDLLQAGSIQQLSKPPLVVNPLGVTENSPGKQRLILDLRYVNDYVYKDYIKFEDWKNLEKYVNNGCFMYKFDLKSGYHHIDIFEEDQNGFS